MNATRRIAMAALAVGLGFSSIPMLTACSAGQLVADTAQKAVKDATGVDVNVDGGGTSLPSDWPADVPVVAGEITGAGSVSTNGAKTLTASVTVSDLRSGYEDAKSKLVAAGFHTDSDMLMDGMSMGMFSNDKYNVAVTTVDAGGKKVGYIVSTKK